MQRTQISLEPDQHAFLLAEARRRHVSMAEIIRGLVAVEMRRTEGDDDPISRLAGIASDGAPVGEPRDVASRHDDYLYGSPLD
jgi:hypothetical protein